MAFINSNSVGLAMANPGHQRDRIQKFGLSESQMHRFGDVLRIINLEAIPVFVSSVRQFGHCTSIVPSADSCASERVSCKIAGVPLCGSFHIVFTLEFDDGIKWMLKISANGHRFDPVAAAALISEVRTMQLLKSATTIPIPAVYAFDRSSLNDLKTSFVLMECLDGQPLYRGWFDDEMPKARLEHFRVRALQSLAEAMAQLNKFTLNRGGALEFDSSGRPIGLRGAKVVDAVAMYDWGSGFENEPEIDQDYVKNDDQHDCHEDNHNNDEVQHTDEDRTLEKSTKDKWDDGNYQDKICEKGPFECPKSAFLFDLNRSDVLCKGSVYTGGCYKALRMFIDLAFSNNNDHGRRFVLTHPDLDVQNVLVAEDGTLRGLIDWDGVAAVPREIGCAQYPLWLMRDWVPYYYVYDIREGKTEEDAGYEESSPAELASYRAMYAHFMEKEIERQTGGPDQITSLGTLPKQEALLTRRSLVMRDLDLAASSPFLTTDILCHILNQIERVTEPEWRWLDLETDVDSSSSRKGAVDSDSDTNSDVNGDTCSRETGIEAQAAETHDEVSGPIAAVASTRRDDEEAALSKSCLPRATAMISDSLSRVPQHDCRSQTPSEGPQIEAKALDMEHSSTANLEADSFPHSALLGWGWRFICFGCNTAEKGLRRVAQIFHVIEDAVEELADVLAEVDLRHHHNRERSNKGEPWQTVKSPSHQQLSGIEAVKDTETKQHENISSTRGMGELVQPREIESVYATQQLPGLATHNATNSDHTDRASPIQATIQLQDIPARKAELINAEKARKRANYCFDKAAIKEELKVWERIALTVSVRGVSLEQLQMNQHKIACWVTDTLRAEQERGGDPVEDSHSLLADEPADQGEKNSPRLQNEDPSLAKPPGSILSNIPVSVSQAGMPSFERESGNKSVIGRKAMTPNDETVVITTKAKSAPYLWPQPSPGHISRSEKASSSFQALCSFGSSCLKKIFSNRHKSQYDDKASQTPDSSVSGNSDGKSNRSGTEDSCKSSVTSLNDDEVGFSESSKTEEKEGEDDLFGTAMIPATENHHEACDGRNDSHAWEDLATIKIRGATGSHNDSAVASGSGREHGFDKLRLPRSVYESYSGNRVGLEKTKDSAMKTKIAGPGVEEAMTDMQPTISCKYGLDTKSEKSAGDGAESDQGSESVGEGGTDEGSVSTFKDDGEFRSRNVFNLLGMDMLDELRLLRMQEGFLKLLELY